MPWAGEAAIIGAIVLLLVHAVWVEWRLWRLDRDDLEDEL